MNSTIRVVATGIAIGILYLLLGVSQRITWPLVPLMGIVVMKMNGVRLRDYFSMPDGLRGNAPGLLWILFAIYSAAFLLRTLFEYRMVSEFAKYPYLGADVVLKNLGLAMGLMTAFLYSRRLTTRGAMWSLVIAIGTNAALNLVLDRLNFREENVFGESRFDFLDARWMPPAVRSNAFFAMSCASGIALFFNLVRDQVAALMKRPLILAALSISLLVLVIAAVKCQFRNNLFAIAVGLPLALIRWRPVLRVSGYGGLAALVIFPSLFMGEFGYSVINFLSPERILKAIGSDLSGSSNMSNRTDLYEYGWENLRDFKVFLIGEGPVLRDAQSAVGGLMIEGYRMPYHSAFIDFLMQFGVIIGVFVVACLAYLLHLGLKRLAVLGNSSTEAHQSVEMGIVYLTVWFALSISDSGMSNFETLWLAVTPLFGALCFTGRDRLKSAISAGSKSRPIVDGLKLA